MLPCKLGFLIVVVNLLFFILNYFMFLLLFIFYCVFYSLVSDPALLFIAGMLCKIPEKTTLRTYMYILLLLLSLLLLLFYFLNKGVYLIHVPQQFDQLGSRCIIELYKHSTFLNCLFTYPVRYRRMLSYFFFSADQCMKHEHCNT